MPKSRDPRAAGGLWAAVVSAVVAGLLLFPAAPAYAYRCPDVPGAVAVSATVPWEGLLFDPARLAPLATGAGVRVAVLDSGVDAGHPQLRGRVAPGRDFLHEHPDARQDCVGHGTAVAAVIAARRLDGTGPRGLAPDVTVVPVRVSEQTDESGAPAGPGRFAEAIDWAVTSGDADVISMSLVSERDDERVRRAVARAIDAGVVVVAAAGNRGVSSPGDSNRGGDDAPTPYPAAYPDVIGVGAIGPDGVRAAFSQHGDYVDVTAPGVDVTVAARGSGHRLGTGTSYATPFVAATAALVRQRFPELTPALVSRRILATADPAPGGPHSDEYGYGVVNPYRALTETLGPDSRAVPPPPAPYTADPALVARQGRRAHAQGLSLTIAAAGAAVLILAAFVGSALGHSRRRQQTAALQRRPRSAPPHRNPRADRRAAGRIRVRSSGHDGQNDTVDIRRITDEKAGPYGITTGPDGALWLTLVHAGQIARLTTGGDVTFFDLGAPGCQPSIITTGPDGALWFTRTRDDRIGRITTAGELSDFPLPPGSGPYGIATGPDGALWITEMHTDRLARLTTGGTLTEFTLPVAKAFASAITAGPDGALWFALNQANAIGRCTTDGTITVHTLPTAGAAPVGVASDGDAIWFVEIGAGQAGRITTDGRITEFPLPDRSARPHAIVAAAPGDCWLTEWGAGRIARLTGTGAITEHDLPEPRSEPHGLTIGPDGAIWAALETGAVARITR